MFFKQNLNINTLLDLVTDKINFNEYDIIEFSYGGSNIIHFINLLYDDKGNPTDACKVIFSKNNLKKIKFVGSSAGCIILLFTFFNILKNYTLSHVICFLNDWMVNQNIDRSDFLYGIKLANMQRDFISILSEKVPELCTTTLASLCKTVGIFYTPSFFTYNVVQGRKVCEESEFLIDIMNASSNIMGIQDVGIYDVFMMKNQPILFKNKKGLLINVSSSDFKGCCDIYDELCLVN